MPDAAPAPIASGAKGMTRRLPFTEAAIVRIVRGAKKAGARQVTFDPSGQVTVHCGDAPPPGSSLGAPAADPAPASSA